MAVLYRLHVDDAETGLEVRRRVAGSVGLSAASVVLTSGGRTFSLIGFRVWGLGFRV